MASILFALCCVAGRVALCLFIEGGFKAHVMHRPYVGPLSMQENVT